MLETYCEIEDVDEYATRYSHVEWQMLQPSQKQAAILDATLDIIAYHRQPSGSGVPWEWGSETLRDAAALQCLYIARNVEQIGAAEKIAATSKGNYSDTILSVSESRGRHLCEPAQVMVKSAMRECGVNGSGAYEFNRA